MALSIPLTQGQTTVVDDADARFASLKWYAKPIKRRTGGFYAARIEQGTTVYLHRVILSATAGVLVDHINGDGLDNRRANLRLATLSQNLMNRVSTSATGFRGVEPSYRKAHPWAACLYKGKRRTRLGSFSTAEEAARAYDRAALAQYGEFAKLNFPAPANDHGDDRKAA